MQNLGDDQGQEIDRQGGTTVITVGLTPPMIGGGLVLAYLATRRLQRPLAAAGQAPIAAAGQAAGSLGQNAGQALGSAAEAAGSGIQTLGQTAGRVVETAGGAATNAVGVVRETAGTVLSDGTAGLREVPRIARDNPALALGAGLGLGALAAMLLPRSAAESQVVRPVSETIVGQAKTIAQDTAEKVQLVADEATTAIRQSASDVGLVPAGSSGGNSQSGV